MEAAEVYLRRWLYSTFLNSKFETTYTLHNRTLCIFNAFLLRRLQLLHANNFEAQIQAIGLMNLQHSGDWRIWRLVLLLTGMVC